MMDPKAEYIAQSQREVGAIVEQVCEEAVGPDAPIDIVLVTRHPDGRISVHRSSGNLASHLGMIAIAQHTLLKGTEVQSSPSGAR